MGGSFCLLGRRQEGHFRDQRRSEDWRSVEGQRDEQECSVEKSQQVKEVPREGHFCMELGKVKGTEESTRFVGPLKC